jgi:hypothetical protein
MSDGPKTLYAWAKDATGNVSTTAVATVNILPDALPPTIDVFIMHPTPDSLIVKLETKFSDARGVTSYYISDSPNSPTSSSVWVSTVPTEFEFVSKGKKNLYLWVKDEAGNMSALASAFCTIITTLSGREYFKQHLNLNTISLDAIKAYIGSVSNTGATALTSDSVIYMPARVSIGGHRVVVQIEGMLDYANAANIDHVNKVVGITKDAIIGGGSGPVQFRSYLEEPSWNWAVDRPVFVGQNGLLTQTIPTVGFNQQLATVISPTKILINIQDPIILGE